ncbi:7-cyano-7-deazaguanine synthase QueC [Gammaproteobacteria bacterium LSUCC0057]|uniref:7-cyano-7-deazaguanine synthase n=1 Tax=Gammaproteobacteria bacterium LSUCC0057 TaxID=2559237 RepID=A0A4Y8UMK1_9GAMM|nr:7-cyano-7-deazaguanine synthase QueC [Gammaproteobacteria bacterium LSUCC0057]
MSDKANAVVLLSGGLDSATVLATAQQRGFNCYSVAFDYGQRHRSELHAAANIAAAAGVVRHQVISIDMRGIGGSALTDPSIAVPEQGGEGIPVTYVPARNTVFLSLALGVAEVVAADHIFIGVNAVDYSGYPDCRPAFIDAFSALANLATKAGVEGRVQHIEAPLLNLSKEQIIALGVSLGVDYAQTVSCYQADDAGRACGRCDSCQLRREGFAKAGVADPTRYR